VLGGIARRGGPAQDDRLGNDASHGILASYSESGDTGQARRQGPAQSLAALLMWRVVQGAGAGASMTIALAAWVIWVSPRHAALALATGLVCGGLASRIGGVISPPYARRRLMGSLVNGCACRVAALVAGPRRAQDKRPRPQQAVRS
jgi:hypothetical protein